MAYEGLSEAIDDITAGETLSATITLTDYPATTHSLEYRFRQNLTHHEATCVASGSDHVLTVPATTTEYWEPGRVLYVGYAKVTATGVVTRADDGALNCYGNPAIITHAQRVLAAIRAVIEGRAADDQLTIALGDVQLRYMVPAELAQWEGFYAQRVQAELDRMSGMYGAGNRRTIRVRFP